MFRYADPHACPGCRAPIEFGAKRCDQCGVPLTGPMAQRLFNTLAHADLLLAQVQPAATGTALPVGEPRSTPELPDSPDVLFPASPGAAFPVYPSSTHRPSAHRPSDRPRGLSAASVPKILLGLGALCLLVAALVFLAVAWSALGVGGRTGVLVLLTTTAGATAAWLARKDLRGGTEAFATVGLGLLTLDVIGADNAGWLGDLSFSSLLVTIGVVVGTAGLAASTLAQETPVKTLVSGQLVASVGALVVGIGLTLSDLDLDTGLDTGLVVAMVVAMAVAGTARALELTLMAWATAAVAGWWWLFVLADGLGQLHELSFAELWLDLDVAMLLVATAVPTAVALVRMVPVPARVVAASVAVALATLDVTLVAFDESATTRALVELGVVAAAAALSARLTLPWRWVTVIPAGAAGLALLASATTLFGYALDALLSFEPWGEPLAGRLDVPDLAWSWPLLLPAGALGAYVAAWLAARCVADLPTAGLAAWFVPIGVITAALVPTLYGVELWVELAVLAGTALGAAALAASLRRIEPLAAAGALGLGLLAASFANPWSTAIALGLVTVASAGPALRGRGDLVLAAGVILPVALAGFVWTVEHLADVDRVWRAVPILVLLGLFAILRPGVERELPVYVSAFAAAVAAVVLENGTGVEQTWLAVYLTLGGVLVTASALIHPSRRVLSWFGLALFTLAQWVRLEQLGVDEVEAYTLPLAVVLLVVGLVAMWRTDISSHKALRAGLGLALVPTLLQVLLEPVSLRALLLGLACLLLVSVGVLQKWAAPLLAGASVGAVVVLREAAYADVLEQWMVIGLVGVLLTLVGVTWERRLAELRLAAGYVRALR
jgi:hypothetical protein